MTTSKINYPNTRRDESVEEDYHGTKVKDPYRWLEDPDSEATKEWVKQQNELYQGVIAECPKRDVILAKLKERSNYPKYSVPFKEGNRYFFYKNEGLQNQSVLYVQDSLDGEPREFLDPNKLSADGTSAISVSKFSDNGEYFAYGISKSGSDWNEIHVIEVQSGAELPEILEWVKYSSIAWKHDNKGFFYARYLKPESLNKEDKTKGTETEAAKNQKIFYHAINTPQREDKLVYELPEQPEWMFGVEITEDGRYLLITVSPNCENVNKFYYVDLQHMEYESSGILKPVKVIDNFEACYNYVANDGTLFYLQTNKNSPKYKIIQLDVTQPDKTLKEVIPEAKEPMKWIFCVSDHLIICYLQDVKEVLKCFTMDGKYLYDFSVPTIGSVSGASGKRKHTELFYSFTSFLHPGVIFHYDFSSKKLSTFREIKVKDFNPDLFTTSQVFYESKDGTKVPMFIVHKKSLELNGQNPTMLYGYGGFYYSLTPTFSVSRVIWMSHYDGVYALANIRGGNEYGEDWHSGGILDRKQNCFDDFCWAAKALVDLKYTSPKKIAINGGSNGGLLVTACLNQHPELFGAGVAQVPVTDMLRFHKFTIGYAWCSDYGCADKPEDFNFLIKYSPLHNVKKGQEYPALLVCTADHDDRVVPLHSFKYISEVQHQLGGESYQTNPLVIRIDVKAGHGAGKPMDKVLEEYADIYSFVAKYTGAVWHE